MDYGLILVFIFGLFVGSFLNVVIYRMQSDESVIRGRSHCPLCGHVLSWYELIPLVSFISQNRRCRACRGIISWQYPLVETACGALFAFAAWWIMWNGQGLCDSLAQCSVFLTFLLVVVSGLLVIFVYDWKHYLIPDSILAILIISTAIALLGGVEITGYGAGAGEIYLGILFERISVGIFSSIPFAAIVVFSRGRWMGLGDAKFAFFMGLLLGSARVIAALFLSVVLGAIVGIVLMAFGKKTIKSEIPFGPFLVIGTLLAFFAGDKIVQWYLAGLGL